MHRTLIILALLAGAGDFTFGSFPTNEQAAYSGMWYHGAEITTTITTVNTFTRLTQFAQTDAEDPNGNLVSDPGGNDDFTVGANDGGVYTMMLGISFKAAGGASKNFQVTPRITPASTVAITDATNASPIVITSADPHNISVGDMITITGVGGNTAANADHYVSVVGTTTTATLQALDHTNTTGNGAYTSGGVIASVSPGNTMIEGVVSGTGLERGFGTGFMTLVAGDVVDYCAANIDDANNLGISHIVTNLRRVQ